ncbi:FkbM family methyltransferase [Polluticoccus soli]|uniref:FkbM family methyltransferase n=1 Tax=Polluticoccus soli TaxID=3034150 RepID=UPI0023E09E61|nr:FkbM family methyltransferase [Flavipsychrobacter sp. JY13-12]
MFRLLGSLIYKVFRVEVRYRGDWKKDNRWLLNYNFNTIIDVGANEGQFAMKMRKFFPAATIISFEPIPEVFDKLNANFAGDSRFLSYCYGLGEEEQEASFFLNEYSPSSSLLKMADHTKHFDAAVKDKEIKVKIARLDDILKKTELKAPILVKLDVQGYEDKVIGGGNNTIKCADVVISEVSFASLYQDQKLFDDIYTALSRLGFKYKGNFDQLRSPVDNSVLQADAIFIKEKN